MSTVKYAPRHREAVRPITPLDNLTQTSQFGRLALRGAGATATGIVLTASAIGAASAAPNPEASPAIEPALSNNALDTVWSDDTQGTIVSLEEDWDSGDVFAAAAEAPEAAPEPEVETETVAEAEATSRDEVRYEAPAITIDGSSVVAAAYSLLGIPYVYGGESTAGTDCSGLVMMAYAAVGISLPHSSGAIAAMGTPVSDPVPGDIVAYSGHVAIYVGNGMMIEAVSEGTLSQVSAVRPGGWFVRI